MTTKTDQVESASSIERLIAATREYEGKKTVCSRLTTEVTQATLALDKKKTELQNVINDLIEIEARIRSLGKTL